MVREGRRRREAKKAGSADPSHSRPRHGLLLAMGGPRLTWKCIHWEHDVDLCPTSPPFHFPPSPVPHEVVLPRLLGQGRALIGNTNTGVTGTHTVKGKPSDNVVITKA